MPPIPGLPTTRLRARPVDVPNLNAVGPKGYLQDRFPSNCYQNIAVLARKGSGKTGLIYDTIRRLHEETGSNRLRVLIFSPTCEVDKMWQLIRRYMDKAGIRYYCNDSFTVPTADGGQLNVLKTLQQIHKSGKGDKNAVYLVIVDDMSFAGRNRGLASLILSNRHFNAIVVMAAQNPQHFDPSVYTNADYMLWLHGLNKRSINFIAERCNVDLTPEELTWLYKKATGGEKYSFLHVDNANDVFRKGYNEAIHYKPCDCGLCKQCIEIEECGFKRRKRKRPKELLEAEEPDGDKAPAASTKRQRNL